MEERNDNTRVSRLVQPRSAILTVLGSPETPTGERCYFWQCGCQWKDMYASARVAKRIAD
jgi:hypothetical protein